MKAAFFDLDGRLVDFRAPISGAINAALRALDLPEQEPSELHRNIGDRQELSRAGASLIVDSPDELIGYLSPSRLAGR